MKRNPDDETPLTNFYAGCEITFPDPLLQKVPKREVLIRGLEFLEQTLVSAESAREFLVILGNNDPFSDSAEMKRRIPQVDVVEGAGHSPETLLRRLAEII